MSEEGRLVLSSQPEKRISVFFLFVLLSSFTLGAVLAIVFLRTPWSGFLPLVFWRLEISSGYLGIFYCVLVFLFPCLFVWFLSTSSAGGIILPLLFLFFGLVTEKLFQIYSSTIRAFPDFFVIILPALFFLPALFLIGEIAFQKSIALYRLSKCNSSAPIERIPVKRLAIVFFLVLLTAVVRQLIVPQLFIT